MDGLALVTGATGGMGVEIVQELTRTHRVIAVGRCAEAVAQLDALEQVTGVVADLTDEDSIAGLAHGIDHLDVLVHAAAVGAHLDLADADAQAWRTHLDTNVIAPALLTRVLIDGLRAARGTVIFIGSGASVRPTPHSVVYPASKHALKGFADCLRLDESAHGVRVTTIMPGPTDTPMLRGMIADYHPERYITPASIARAVRFVVDADNDVQITDVAVRPRTELR